MTYCQNNCVRVCLRLSSFFLSSVGCPLISGFWKRLIAQAGLLVKQRRLFRGSSLRSQHGAENILRQAQDRQGKWTVCTCRLLKKSEKRPQTSYRTRRSRDPVSSEVLFFWIPDSRFATSGMTDLPLALKIPSFSVATRDFGNLSFGRVPSFGMRIENTAGKDQGEKGRK